ncbi:hypothetical protein [Streptomyces alboflavus]|uniref:hypothetical protein n=1 Tax=Streptomyces alboflavus TaxID=67267 RepID=UPI000F6580F7|nr:hypothetical protein [Streptomyces alboflavus]
MAVSTHVDSFDGRTYLRTQHGDSAVEIADSLRPYVGRLMRMDLPNPYGHYHAYWGYLRSVEGGDVTVYVPRYDHTATLSAFDVFGTHCTVIKPESVEKGVQ